MKILNCKQQKEADAYTIEHEGILSINLMARRVAVRKKICFECGILILCQSVKNFCITA